MTLPATPRQKWPSLRSAPEIPVPEQVGMAVVEFAALLNAAPEIAQPPLALEMAELLPTACE
jgi:hypothetical protein